MTPANVELVKLALSAGSFGLLVLLGAGTYKLADKWLPLLIGAVAAQAEALAKLAAKIDDLADCPRGGECPIKRGSSAPPKA